jgi:hypothetical protein
MMSLPVRATSLARDAYASRSADFCFAQMAHDPRAFSFSG